VLALLAVVVVLHALALWWLREALTDWGRGATPMPARMEVAFVRELVPAAPPVVAPSPPRAPAMRSARSRAAATPAAAASTAAPQPGAPAPMSEPITDPAADPALPLESAAALPTVAASAVASSAASAAASAAAADAVVAGASAPLAAAAAPFEWPPSTRLSYTLAGNYRGEVHGQARVQWVRLGSRYQVHLDVTIGPSFAPLIERRMTSDGDLGESGLAPRRYDEATRLPFQSPRRAALSFTPQQVTLANGSVRDVAPGVQDTASQFVQLTWLFTTQPHRLRVGESVDFPLALPRRVDRWFYDVVGQEQLPSPLGALDTFHLKPRRAGDRPRSELSAEVWIAPTLQYLPVRIRIQQDADNFVDLMLNSAPLQAEPSGAAR
jgi:hypothetical protein